VLCVLGDRYIFVLGQKLRRLYAYFCPQWTVNGYRRLAQKETIWWEMPELELLLTNFALFVISRNGSWAWSYSRPTLEPIITVQG